MKLGLPWGVQEEGRGEKLQVRMRVVRARGRALRGKPHVRGRSLGGPQTGADPEEGGVAVFQGSLGLKWQLFLSEGGRM